VGLRALIRGLGVGGRKRKKESKRERKRKRRMASTSGFTSAGQNNIYGWG